MKLRDYQRAAARTDQFPGHKSRADGTPHKAEMVPLLGLTGEVGALLSEYKKLLRDGPVHLRFSDRLVEELGDTLWYVAAVATKFDLSLEKIAAANLKKVRGRWLKPGQRKPFDTAFPATERLPRTFAYTFSDARNKAGTPAVVLRDRRGNTVGDPLTDNAYSRDGYRFHDIMHLSFVSVLGWSPVARKLLGRKRKSRRLTDEVEDGGRAAVIDEAIVAMVFDYIGRNVANTEGLRRIDSETLRSVRALTRGFEVHERTEAEWEDAILKGLSVWRQVEAHGGGTVVGDFSRRSFKFRRPPKRMRTRLAPTAHRSPTSAARRTRH